MRNHLTAAMMFALMTYVKEEYTKSGLNDPQFAEAAGRALEFPVSDGNVRGARMSLNIPSNFIKRARREPEEGGCATKEDLAVVLEAVKELTKRLDTCAKRIETYFNVKRD